MPASPSPASPGSRSARKLSTAYDRRRRSGSTSSIRSPSSARRACAFAARHRRYVLRSGQPGALDPSVARWKDASRACTETVTDDSRRVLLKLSGEAFGGGSLGVNPDVVSGHRPGDRRGAAEGGRDRDRRRRRQLLPRRRTQPARHGPRSRRLHGHARHRHERPRAAGLPRAGRRRDARAVRDLDDPGRRAVHPAPRRAPPREGPRRHLRRRRRTAVLLHRHRRRAARARDRRRRRARRQERRRRRLRRRPAHQQQGRPSSTTSPTRRRSCGA